VKTNATKVFQALGDPTRRRLFEKLARGPLAVVDLSVGARVSRPAVSQHLRILKRAGLLSMRRVGTKHYYQVEQAGVRAMRDYLDQFWGTALEAFKQHAEQPENTKP
jgi:DNA-binding transcriptional ArsR family regulator